MSYLTSQSYFSSISSNPYSKSHRSTMLFFLNQHGKKNIRSRWQDCGVMMDS